MKNFKKIIASFAAAAVAATGMFSAIPASAEMVEVPIEYIEKSEGALAFNNDGSTLRLNLYNVWGNEIEDMNNVGTFEEKISVDFTITGLGDTTGNMAEDGTVTPYTAYLSGMAGTNSFWGEGEADNTVENEVITITGDGDYTAEFMLADATGTVECLFLTTNINVFQFSETGSIAESGLDITVTDITTMGEDVTDPDAPVGTIGTATLIGQIGAEQVWAADEITAGSTVANVNGDAKYMVEWVCGEGGGTEGIEFLVVQIPGLTSDTYPDLAVTIDEVYVDGAPVAGYKPSAGAVNLAYYEGAGATRLNLIDRWSGADVADLAADTTITQSVKVVFTVSGTGVEGTSNVPAAGGNLQGDATLDGVVNLYDAIAIAKHMMGILLEGDAFANGDWDSNGVVNLYDAISVCKYMMG